MSMSFSLTLPSHSQSHNPLYYIYVRSFLTVKDVFSEQSLQARPQSGPLDLPVTPDVLRELLPLHSHQRQPAQSSRLQRGAQQTGEDERDEPGDVAGDRGGLQGSRQGRGVSGGSSQWCGQNVLLRHRPRGLHEDWQSHLQ